MRAPTLAISICALSCGRGALLQDARVLVPGVGVAQHDCRAGVCQHNENTDLVRYRGALYLVHRTAESQVLGPNSSLRISRSTDGGASWTLQAVIPALEGRDLRDPHFYEVNGELFIKAITRLPYTSFRDAGTASISVATHSADGASWAPLQAIGPTGWSFWRPRQHAGTWYSAAYADGDQSVSLFSSADGLNWAKGADLYTVSADTPLETELMFTAQGLLALVRMDGTDQELLGTKGRLRTKVCRAQAPYAVFDCSEEIGDQRLDGPLALSWNGRLFVVARKHLGAEGRKRTSIFELLGNPDAGPLQAVERLELPSAGDTAYAGGVMLDGNRILLSWYSSDRKRDPDWVLGQLSGSDIWLATVDLSQLHPA